MMITRVLASLALVSLTAVAPAQAADGDEEFCAYMEVQTRGAFEAAEEQGVPLEEVEAGVKRWLAGSDLPENVFIDLLHAVYKQTGLDKASKAYIDACIAYQAKKQ